MFKTVSPGKIHPRGPKVVTKEESEELEVFSRICGEQKVSKNTGEGSNKYFY